MDYSAELSQLDDASLANLLESPETAFPAALWEAILAERDRRAMLVRVTEAARRSAQQGDPNQDISSWEAVAITMKTASDVERVYDAIRTVIASDPVFGPFRQDGYPLDLYVTFPVEIPGAEGSLSANEQMWVRAIAVAATPNHWIGRLLNAPAFPVGAEQNSYVEFRADNRGLRFVRVAPNPRSSRPPREEA